MILPVYRNPRLSPDEKWIAVEHQSAGGGNGTTDIWLVEARRGRPQKLTSAAGAELSPVWSHDSHSVTYGTQRPAVLRQRIEAPEAEAETLWTPDAPTFPQDYSRLEDLLLTDTLIASLCNRPTAFLLSLAERSATQVLQILPARVFTRVCRPDGSRRSRSR